MEADLIEKAACAALERGRVEAELEGFVEGLKRDNPDLVAMEGYIAHLAQASLQQRQSEIKSLQEFKEHYKAAVTSAVAEARKLVQQLRGAGKEEAAKRQTEVISTTATIPPSPVSQSREPQPPPAPESTQDYLAKRAMVGAKLRGVG